MKRTLAVTVILLVIFAPALGVSPAFGAAPARIVSLAPNITEILYDLGLEDRVVAVTDFCDYPPAAKAKPRVGGFTNPSLEAIVGARPDLVILTDDGNPKAIYNRLRDLGIPCHVFSARRLKELPGGIRELGLALGAEKEASALAGRIEKDMAALEKKARSSTRPLESSGFATSRPTGRSNTPSTPSRRSSTARPTSSSRGRASCRAGVSTVSRRGSTCCPP
jgi:ABC-type hemin transport system substrate-binding protein